jgi:hypothetical protein
MTRPGTQIISRDQAPPRSAPPTQTGPWFAVGQTATGPLNTPTLVRSLASYESTFGARSGGTLLYDAVETFFREGGSRVYISAIPTTPSATAAEAKPTKKTAAKEGEEPEAQAAPTTAQLQAALDAFAKTLGPGQVSIPGNSDPTMYDALLAHAEATNRVALLDVPPGVSTAAALVSIATGLHDSDGARFGALFGPWAVVPGTAGGTSRSVPYSAVEAGIIARNEALGLNPNIAAAGQNGLSIFATDLAAQYTDLEYEQLNDAGVDMARLIYGGVETYGYRTVVDAAVDSLWESFGNSRLHMAICAQADAIAERYVFAQIDGRRKKIAQFGSELAGMLAPFYDAGALYGASPEEAFDVDVGNQVNTDETIAAGELHAVLKVKMSPFAEAVIIEIVRVALTDALAA